MEKYLPFYSRELINTDVQRYMRVWDLRHLKRRSESAIVIQKNYRMSRARKNFLEAMQLKYVEIVVKYAIMLQSIYKMRVMQQNVKFDFLVQQILAQRNYAATKIQKVYKGHFIRGKIKFELLVNLILTIRSQAAIKLQRNIRRIITQRMTQNIFMYEKNFHSLKWKYNAGEVFVIANFTKPAWQKEIRLDFCPLREIFVKYFRNIPPGVYEIKFIVDHEYLCDGKLPIVRDKEGNYNNLFNVEEKDIYSPSSITDLHQIDEEAQDESELEEERTADQSSISPIMLLHSANISTRKPTPKNSSHSQYSSPREKSGSFSLVEIEEEEKGEAFTDIDYSYTLNDDYAFLYGIDTTQQTASSTQSSFGVMGAAPRQAEQVEEVKSFELSQANNDQLGFLEDNKRGNKTIKRGSKEY